MAYEIAQQLHAQGQGVNLLVLMDPAVVTPFSKLLHGFIRRSSHLLHLSEQMQIEWFLRLLHLYESVRLIRRREQEAELLKSVEGIQSEHTSKNANSAFPSLKSLFPSTKMLFQNYRNLYSWVSLEYVVTPYPGKRRALHGYLETQSSGRVAD